MIKYEVSVIMSTKMYWCPKCKKKGIKWEVPDYIFSRNMYIEIGYWCKYCKKRFDKSEIN